ncbi:MAG: sulfatase [Phycisphaerales bacterium]
MRILYLDLDALTPSHLSCYGYPRKTSPTMDALAAKGARFTNYYTSDAPCLPSRTAFYSGRFGIQTGVVGHGGTAAEPKRQGADRGFRDWFDEFGFARQLQNAGYHTAIISPFGQRHAAHWFYAGFNEIHNTGQGGMESAEVVTPVIDRWLAANAKKDDWYLHINFWDIHTPYRAPESYGNPFENEPLPEWFTDEMLERHIRMTGPHTATDLGMYWDATDKQYPRMPAKIADRASLKRYIDGYDTAIRYVDDRIKSIIDKLKADGVYDDTLMIVSADHGENQCELGIYGEHGTADQGTCNIPMIVSGPGVRAGVVDDGLHYNIDWAPTVMDLLKREKPALWDGESFVEILTKGENFRGQEREQLVVSQCCHVCQRSVRWDAGDKRWLYMRTYHDGFHLFPREMLYELASDPREQRDVSADYQAECREGAWRLMQWHDEQMRKMAAYASDSTDPLWTVVREGGPFHAGLLHGHVGVAGLLKYLERLEATGRAEGAAELREKYGRFLGKGN